MKLRTKLLTGFLLCNIVMLVVGFIGLWGVSSLQGILYEITSETLASVKTLLTISEAESFSRAAFRSLLIADLPADRVDNQVRYIHDSHDRIEKEIMVFNHLKKTSEEETLWKEFNADFKLLSQNIEEFMKLSAEFRSTGNRETYTKALALHLGDHAIAFNKMRKDLDSLLELNMKEAADISLVSGRTGKKIKTLFIIAIVMALIAGVSTALILERNIHNQLGGDPSNIKNVAQAVAKGDLTIDLDISRAREGSVQQSVSLMVDNLSKLVSHITNSSCSVSTASVQLHGNTEHITNSFREIESQTTSISIACEEMSATSSEIAKNCHMAATNSTNAGEAAQFGVGVVSETIQGMKKIAERVRSSAETVQALGSRSEQIGQIIGTIEDIADQTNLLALNAAIEAARAGEQGRGFAVVADEVRALAERTSKATHEISDMIKTIQNETKDAVSTMVQGVAEVELGMDASRKSEQALADILSRINEVSSQITQIAIAAEEQTATTHEISQNVNNVTGSIDNSANAALESVGAVAELIKLAEELLQSVREVKTADNALTMLNIARNDHIFFVSKIRSAVLGHTKLDPAALPTHHTCRFGKWYDTQGKECCGHLSSYREIDPPHEKIHAVAKEAVAAANSGNNTRALELFAEVERTSHVVVDKLARTGQEYRQRS